MAEAQAAAPKKGSGKIILISAAVLLLGLGSGGAAAYFLLPGLAQGNTAAKAVPPQPIQYYELKDSFTTNLQGSDRLVQVKLACSTTRGDTVLAALDRHQPAIVAAALNVLSEATEEDVESQEGRSRLEERFRTAINHVLQQNAGMAGAVDHVFLTSLVLQ